MNCPMKYQQKFQFPSDIQSGKVIQILMDAHNKMCGCDRNECAWWDEDAKFCAVASLPSIAFFLNRITSMFTIKKLEDK